MNVLQNLTEHQIALDIAGRIKNQVKTMLPPCPTNLRESLGILETAMITMALEKHAGNQVKAAKDLGLKESVLRFRMKKRNIARKHGKKS